MEVLRESILSVRRKNIESRYFIPNHEVKQLMTPASIREILLDSGMERQHVAEVSEIILNGAWNVFAILILIRHPIQVRCFIEDDSLRRSSIDHKLPFELESLQRLLNRSSVAGEFYDTQWQFTAPLFSKSLFTRCLPDDCVLPFLSDKECGEGSFGVVHRIQVERSHQVFNQEPYYEVVRKEFRPRYKETEYETELRNLSILKLIKHPNIVELLGSYNYRGKHNFVFPLASGGNLAELLKKPCPSSLERRETIMFAMSGLCSAVSAMHTQFSDDRTLISIGCHHDLKPSNVLVDNATFLLADFGLSRFKESYEDSGTAPRTVVGYYVAPECGDLATRDKRPAKPIIGRASDIWSLGCIMCELLVYMDGGPDEVARFENERLFKQGQDIFHRFHQGPDREEPTVSKRLADLRIKAESRPEQMIIELVRSMLRLDPKDRPKADEVDARMAFIAIDQASQDIHVLYKKVLDIGKSPQAFIEQERFNIWLSLCKSLYIDDCLNVPNRWGTRSFSEHQSAKDCLTEIRETLQRILPDCEKPTRRIYCPLETLNDVLIAILPQELQKIAREHLEVEILRNKIIYHHIDNLDDNDRPDSGKVQILARIKHMNEEVASRSEARRPDLWIEPPQLERGYRLGNLFVGHLAPGQGQKEVKVLYERKPYGSHRLEGYVRRELHARLEAVVELLLEVKESQENRFRVLRCCGYFHDQARLACGLVYQFPESSREMEFTTLHTVLVERRTQPALGKKFDLARRLAASVMEFHKVTWLQKSISSFNIAFFHSATYSWVNGIGQPYFLGFIDSRPDLPTVFTEYMDNPAYLDYQHPEYLAGKGEVRYQTKFDYYSLGLVLLEIGFWKSLSEVTQGSGSPELMRQRLLKDVIPQLGVCMGVIYQRVVTACIGGDFESLESGQAPGLNDNLYLAFRKVVVENLARCIA